METTEERKFPRPGAGRFAPCNYINKCAVVVLEMLREPVNALTKGKAGKRTGRCSCTDCLYSSSTKVTLSLAARVDYSQDEANYAGLPGRKNGAGKTSADVRSAFC